MTDRGDILAYIASVQVGRPVPARLPWPREGGTDGPPSYLTAIAKAQVAGDVAVGRSNLDGDAQADTLHHGGPDKAVHAHFAQHLAWWGARRGRPVQPGEIGENLTLRGGPGAPEPDEAQFCIGDLVRAGSALLQVTQPRIPCFKQAAALQLRDGAALAASSGRTGLYLRVVEPGTLRAGDPLRCVERPHPDVTVADANRFVRGDRQDADLRARLSRCVGLGADIRRRLGEERS